LVVLDDPPILTQVVEKLYGLLFAGAILDDRVAKKLSKNFLTPNLNPNILKKSSLERFQERRGTRVQKHPNATDHNNLGKGVSWLL
jgi:hypothetical protein